MSRRRSVMYGFLALIMFLSTILLPLSSVISSGVASAHEGEEHGHKILAISKTTGFRHASIDQGAKIALPEMAKKYGFEIDFTENTADINAANLAKYDVVFFVSTTGNFSDWGLTDQQKQDFMNFIKSGKGYVGAHSATDTGYDWQEYGDLTGAYFSHHPWTQTVKFNVEDSNNPATAHLGPSWTALEEVYYFKENPRDKGKHILLSLDMNSNGVTGGPFEDHPNAWCSPVQNGRMFYTALGHHPETWFKEDFQQHLLGGLKYAWGEANDTDCDQSSPKGGLQKVSLVKGTIASPVGIDISKSGEIFVISLFGKVYTVSQEGDTKEILNIPTNLEGEHGLLGLALDPDFESNHYIYLYYTNPVKTAEGKLINNVARFTYENGVISANTEKNLLKVTSDVTCCHQAGYLKFGPDGKLYLTIGDNNSPTQGPQTRSLQTSQNLDDMRGKILRFNKDGSASNDNPYFTGQGGARDYVYAWGFRNPYRISFDTTKGNGKTIIYEGDVGPDGTFANGSNGDYDEFNAVTAPGQNFGWPYGIGDKVYNKKDYAGANNLNEINDALYAEKFATTKKPIAFYPYTNDPIWGTGGRTALAGPVYDYTGPNAIPGLKGKFLAYDFTRNWVKAVTTDDNGEIVKVEDFLSGMLAPIDMKLGPDGALYIAEFGKSWESDEDDGITKVFYGQLHRNPVIKAKASAVSGKTPLTVNFDTTGTSDLDGDTIAFAWNFGDGTTSRDANPSHTYSINGNYDVTLTVTNGSGKFSVWNTKITVGNTAPVVKITSPANGSFFTNGETITATAFATDDEDGPIACDKIQWSVNLLHDAHYHPFPGTTGCTPTITLFDDGHGPEAKIAWNIAATVTDNGAPGTTPLSSSDSITFKNKRIHAEDFDATGGASPTAPADQGVKTESTSDMYGGKNVGFTERNDWFMFKHIDINNIKKMYFRMASESNSLNMEVRLDSPTGEKIATAAAPTTKGWQNWTTISSDVVQPAHNLDAAQADFHDLYFFFPAGGNNINWIQFAYAGDAAPTEKDVCNANCSGGPGTSLPDVSGSYSRTGWAATASHSGNQDPAANGIDGKQTTRWSTGVDAAPDMWYQIDMGKVQKVDRIVVDHGSQWPAADVSKHPDYFRGYDLQVSMDGKTWTTVASKDSSWNKLVVDEKFKAMDARYIKMVNKGSAKGFWLSIHEMYVFPPSGGGTTYDTTGALNRTNWAAKASHGENFNSNGTPPDDPKSCLKCAFDGDLFSRWTTGTPMKAGMWYQVDLGAATNISRVLVDFGSLWTTEQQPKHPDYFRGYNIQVSLDGTNWTSVASADTYSEYVVDKSFAAVNARYVRIENTKDDTTNSWYASIHELYVFPAKSSDATLKSITWNGKPLSGFSPEIYSYQVVLPAGTTAVPEVGAAANHEKATFAVQAAPAIPGTTTVLVTAENGSTQSYEVNFVFVSAPASQLTGPADVHSGQSFDLTYSLSNLKQKVYAQDLTFSYDSTQLEFVSADGVRDDIIVVDKGVKQNQIRIIIANLAGDKATGDVLKLHFRAKVTSQVTSSAVTLTNVVLANGEGEEIHVEGSSYSVQIHGVDKASLRSLIAEAQSKHDAAVEGTNSGQYPVGSKAVLQAAIDQAKAVADNAEAAQEQVEQAVTELAAALQVFTASVNISKPGDLTGDGRYSIGDLAIMAAAYGKTSADPDWNLYKYADLNNDGIVDILDLAALARLILE